MRTAPVVVFTQAWIFVAAGAAHAAEAVKINTARMPKLFCEVIESSGEVAVGSWDDGQF